ncbi:low affinity iron permease family protein [Plastoroseomonas hellenica]|uniref:low affinity iron permease family protein n=1 Tax=Plastoroseomonas hellenica TaxID=2687306 RepID=UPI001BA72A29|nr:low affinity iron permease family protein [Plastoroseomonas hellenica]MBR0644651.1 low affinity iron permease family protein [Plastoroseomonas hellenica]
MNKVFAHIAQWVAEQAGRPHSFIMAAVIVIFWGASGPLFGFSDTWQLVINTGTTIVTFLMVFLIQNSQNRDTRALHLKLDELIRVTSSAKNSFINLEDHTEQELEALKRSFDDECQAAPPLTTAEDGKPQP